MELGFFASFFFVVFGLDIMIVLLRLLFFEARRMSLCVFFLFFKTRRSII